MEFPSSHLPSFGLFLVGFHVLLLSMSYASSIGNFLFVLYVCYCVHALTTRPEIVNTPIRYCIYTSIFLLIVTPVVLDIARLRGLYLLLYEDHQFITEIQDVDKSGWAAAQLEELEVTQQRLGEELGEWEDRVRRWPLSWLYQWGWINLPKRNQASSLRLSTGDKAEVLRQTGSGQPALTSAEF